MSELDPKEKAMSAAFKKAMRERNTRLDSERIDSFFLNDESIRSSLRVYESEEGGFSVYGQDQAAERLRRKAPELFRDHPGYGGTPPRVPDKLHGKLPKRPLTAAERPKQPMTNPFGRFRGSGSGPVPGKM